MDYQNLVVKSFQIAWKHKWLWIFGFFAGAGISAPNFGGGGSLNWSEQPPERVSAQVSELGHQYWPLLLGLALILFFVLILFTIAGIFAHAALIRGAAAINEDRETSFSLSLKEGSHYFGRLLGLGLLLFVVVVMPILGFFGTTIWAFLNGYNILGVLFGLMSALFVLALLPLGVLLALLFHFSTRAIVLLDHRILESLGSAWALVRANFGTSLILWLVSLLLTMGFAASAFFIMLILGVPLVIFGILSFANGYTLATIGIFAFLVIAALAVLAIFTSGFRALVSTYWTLAFLRLTAGAKAKETPEVSAKT